MKQPSIMKNAAISLLISGIGYLYPMLVFIYIARILHPEGLGSVRFAASIAAFFVMFTELGMPIYGMRATAGAEGELSRLTAELLLIRLLTGVLSWAAFLVVLKIWPSNGLLPIYGLLTLVAIPDCTWLYKGRGDYASLAWISAGAHALGLGAVFMLVRKASDVGVYAGIAVAVPLVTNLSELLLAERKWKLGLLAECERIIAGGALPEVFRRHIKSLLLFLLMTCAVTIYSHTDTVMLGIMADERTVGLYSCAAKIKGVLPALTGALWAAALPKAAELWRQKNIEAFRALSERSFHVIYMVMLPLTVYFIIFADPWVMLIGGMEYMDAAGTMRLLLMAVIPIGFSNIIGGQMLIPMEQERRLFHAEAMGALSNILLNAILIPALSAAGAAIATTVSEVLVAVLAWRAVRQSVSVRVLQAGNLARGLAGCAVAGMVACIVGSRAGELLRGPLTLFVFGVVFCLAMLLFHDVLYREAYATLKNLCPCWLRKPLGAMKREAKRACYMALGAMSLRKARYFCPCCGVRLRAFVDGGFTGHPECYNIERYVDIRQDVICPVCGALPRHRILACWCDENIHRLKGRDILYFAPEKSMLGWMKRNGVVCTTADLYSEADLKMDIQATGLPDRSYDVVVCNHVLEHVQDFRRALRELHRILRADGRLICSFPMDPNIETLDEDPSVKTEAERRRRFGQIDHLRVFGMRADVFLNEAGFRVEIIDGKNYGMDILPVVGPADYDIDRLFCSTKVPTGDG